MPHVDDATLNASLKFATGVLARQERIEINLVASDIAPQRNSPGNAQFMHHYAHEEAMDRALDALVVIGASAQLAQTQCAKLVENYNIICSLCL